MTQINTIEVAGKPLFKDSGSSVLSALEIALREIGIKDARAFSSQIFTIDGEELDETKLIEAGELLHHKVTQDAFSNKPIETKKLWDFAIRVDYKPGVTDNAARVLKKDLGLIGVTESDVYTSDIHYVKGEFNEKIMDELERIASNPQIHEIKIVKREEFEKNKGFSNKINPVILPDRPVKFDIDLGSMVEEELIKTGKLGTLNMELVEELTKTNPNLNTDKLRGGTLSLALDYMLAIQEYANSSLNTKGQNKKGFLTDVELEMLAQMWSEHCRHSLFNASIPENEKGIFDEFIKKPTLEVLKNKPHLGVSIYKDNAGVFKFNDRWLIAIKNETHNSPSALDPYGGAITGIVGVNRDPAGTGRGAELIANALFYFLGLPKDKTKHFKRRIPFNEIPEKAVASARLTPDKKWSLEELMLNPKQIFDGVVSGVQAGGNQMGIPINQGSCTYHERYNGKPIVGVESIGRMPIKIGELLAHEKHIDVGDRLYIVGGRAGMDGIHGATFSSEALTENSPATAVQIGDPYTQRKMFEALLEARDKGYINFVTDLGAGGVSCAALEMAEKTNGLDIDLDKLLIKYEGMTATELFENESQERMAVAINEKHRADFEAIMKKHEVEFSDIGKFTNSGRALVSAKNQLVVDMDMNFIHNGFPKRSLNPKDYKLTEEEQKSLSVKFENEVFCSKQESLLERKTFSREEFLEMHQRPNLASIAFFMDKMDSTVKGLGVQHCIQGRGRVTGRASCFMPDIESNEGLIHAYGHSERQSYIDSEKMGVNSFLRSIGNNIAMGGRLDYMVATDQFLWQNSDDPKYQQMLIETNKGMAKVIRGCELPVISGKDSMYNQVKMYDEEGNVVARGVFPTLLMTTLAKIDDINNIVTIDAKQEGDLVYVVGSATKNDMGGSEYMNMYSDKAGLELHIGNVSDENISEVYDTFGKMNKATDAKLLQSAIYIENGGLAMALRNTAMAGEQGIEVDLAKLHKETECSIDGVMYGETEGRFVVTVKPENKKAFEKIFKEKYSEVGVVKGDKLIIKDNSARLISEGLDKLLEIYHEPDKVTA